MVVGAGAVVAVAGVDVAPRIALQVINAISEPTISRYPQRANELPSERSSQRFFSLQRYSLNRLRRPNRPNRARPPRAWAPASWC